MSDSSNPNPSYIVDGYESSDESASEQVFNSPEDEEYLTVIHDLGL